MPSCAHTHTHASIGMHARTHSHTHARERQHTFTPSSTHTCTNIHANPHIMQGRITLRREFRWFVTHTRTPTQTHTHRHTKLLTQLERTLDKGGQTPSRWSRRVRGALNLERKTLTECHNVFVPFVYFTRSDECGGIIKTNMQLMIVVSIINCF